MPDVEPPAPCPRCSATLIRVGEEPDWCPDCEWNLVAEAAHRSRLRRRVDAYVLDQDGQIAAELSGRLPGPPGWTPGRVALLTLSVLLGAGVVGLFCIGIALVVTATVGWKVLGALLALMAVELRPRLPRLTAVLGLVHRGDQPALFAELDRICAELDAPRIHAVVLDESFEATCGRYGWRRRPVLHLGLPVWAALTPSARVALMSHQIAHLVDGDPSAGWLSQPTLSTFGSLARLFDPRAVVRRHQIEARTAYDGAIMSRTSQGFLLFEWIANVVSAVVFAPLNLLFGSVDFLLQAMSARTRRRAEHYADALTVQMAGTEATIEFLETLLLSERVSTAMHRWLRVGADVQMLRAEAQDARERNRPDQRRAEQRSIRDESIVLADHPPVGRRLRLVRSWPVISGRLVADEASHDAIDAQLAPAYRRVERALANLL